jgi:hypothetical protein
VLSCPIPLILAESIPRIALTVLYHPVITVGFGQNGSGSDRQGAGISFDQAGLGKGDIWEFQIVDQQILSGQGQPIDSPPHGQARRGQDAQLVDLAVGGPADAPSAG